MRPQPTGGEALASYLVRLGLVLGLDFHGAEGGEEGGERTAGEKLAAVQLWMFCSSFFFIGCLR